MFALIAQAGGDLLREQPGPKGRGCSGFARAHSGRDKIAKF